MQPSEEQNREVMTGWSDEEEFVIAAIQQTESVPRAEAIRRMRRRKLDDLKGRIRPLSEVLGDHGNGTNAPPQCNRSDGERRAIPKGGRPRKYRTDRERRIAERQQHAIRQRAYRKRLSVTENPLISDSFHVSTEAENRPLASQ